MPLVGLSRNTSPTVVWSNLESVVAIHGHDGRTRIVFAPVGPR